MHVHLLHSRLSIIDLNERSNQPFTHQNATLVFSGEIYNYVELRKELEQTGESFITNSDTEVLLRSYIRHGRTCVDKFEGMWSFAIWDERIGELFLSRDRFAEKPLYTMQTRKGFYFGSEVKFLMTLSGNGLTINQKQISRFLVNGYKAIYKTRETFFEEVEELRFAETLTIGPTLVPNRSRYWFPRVRQRDEMTIEEAVEGFRERLLESLRIRLRSDVPLAFCLSGGIDSSSLASIAAKIFHHNVKTYSIIDDDERYNERDNIMATVNDIGCDARLVSLGTTDTLKQLRELIAYHDAPVYTMTYYIHSLLLKEISADGIRVVVSGSGADELVTGYYDHFNLHLYEMRDHPDFNRLKAEWKEHILPVVRNPHLQNPNLYMENPEFRAHNYLNNDLFAACLTKDFHEEFTEEKYCDSLLRNRMLNELFHEGTCPILHEDDLNSMFRSVENRSPFLDSRLCEFAFSIPNRHLISNGYAKHVLREAVKGILNEKVRTDRRKKGFNAAIESLVDLKSPACREELLDSSPIFDWVRKEKIEEIMSRDTLPNSFGKFLFSFVSAKFFVEEFVGARTA